MGLAEKLRKLMVARGTSRAAIARRAGVSKSAVSNWFNGKNSPDVASALQLARALGVTLDYLADDDQEEPPPPEITADERAVVELLRALGLDRAEALRRLATRPEPAPSGKAEVHVRDGRRPGERSGVAS